MLSSLFSVEDRRDLYLTVHAVKPATLISGRARTAKESRDYEEFRSELSQFGVPHSYEPVSDDRLVRRSNTVERDRGIVHAFSIGADVRSLERLISAETLEDEGFAFGYPERSVRAYAEDPGAESYFLTLRAIRDSGTGIPRFLAYIAFVPAGIDAETGFVPDEVREIGETYRTFIRRHDPEFANEIEESFVRRPLPARNAAGQLVYAPEELGRLGEI